MCPKNETVIVINNHVFTKLPEEGVTLLSDDSVEDSSSVNFPTMFLNSLTPSVCNLIVYC